MTITGRFIYMSKGAWVPGIFKLETPLTEVSTDQVKEILMEMHNTSAVLTLDTFGMPFHGTWVNKGGITAH